MSEQVMAAWRRRALELFPQLGQELHARDYTIYLLFFDLLVMARGAHDNQDTDALRRIYGFAAWCFAQQAEDLCNAAAVGFYEHLFDRRQHWESVISWLSPEVVNGCWPLWESRLSEEELEQVKRLLTGRREHPYRDAHL